MKRLLSLILVVCLSFVVNKGFAQFQSKPLGSSSPATKQVTKPATTTTVAASPATTTTATAGKSVQKLPSPYLLKKDFEDRIAGVEGAANSAKKATNNFNLCMTQKNSISCKNVGGGGDKKKAQGASELPGTLKKSIYS